MQDNMTNEIEATRRRKLDELFADDNYLSTAFIANGPTGRMADSMLPLQIPVISIEEDEAYLELTQLRGRQLRSMFVEDNRLAPKPRQAPNHALHIEQSHVPEKIVSVNEKGTVRLELILDFRSAPPLVSVAGTPTSAEVEVMTAKEAALFLRLSEGAVRSWAHTGEIPCARLGRRLRFRRTALLVWLEAQEKQPLGSGNSAG